MNLLEDTADLPEGDRADPQHWFRAGATPLDAPMWWQLTQQAELVEALRSLCSGPAPLVQLRLWVFMELMALPQARLSRDTLNLHFHLLREDALELALRPLRSAGLLEWDAGTLEYGVTPRAAALMALLAPLTQPAEQDTELAGLLAQVAGAHQLGTLQPSQLRHLQAQLARLHDEFADAIASGSEFRLRRARERHERVFELIDRASQVLAAITAQAQEHAATLRLARDIGLAQARLLAMKSQFDRALHQVERQRVTLGSTGVTTTDVRRWLRGVADPAALLGDALALPVRPVFIMGHDMLDVAEAEFERDRPVAQAEALPEATAAPAGELHALSLPKELGALIDALAGWQQQADGAPARDMTEALQAGGADPRYAAVAYRAQLMPLLGDPQSQDLKGATGDLARLPWRPRWTDRVQPLPWPEVAAASAGWLHAPDAEPPPHDPLPIPPETDTPATSSR
jgi:hypothetical protein